MYIAASIHGKRTDVPHAEARIHDGPERHRQQRRRDERHTLTRIKARSILSGFRAKRGSSRRMRRRPKHLARQRIRQRDGQQTKRHRQPLIAHDVIAKQHNRARVQIVIHRLVAFRLGDEQRPPAIRDAAIHVVFDQFIIAPTGRRRIDGEEAKRRGEQQNAHHQPQSRLEV